MWDAVNLPPSSHATTSEDHPGDKYHGFDEKTHELIRAGHGEGRPRLQRSGAGDPPARARHQGSPGHVIARLPTDGRQDDRRRAPRSVTLSARTTVLRIRRSRIRSRTRPVPSSNGDLDVHSATATPSRRSPAGSPEEGRPAAGVTRPTSLALSGHFLRSSRRPGQSRGRSSTRREPGRTDGRQGLRSPGNFTVDQAQNPPNPSSGALPRRLTQADCSSQVGDPRQQLDQGLWRLLVGFCGSSS